MRCSDSPDTLFPLIRHNPRLNPDVPPGYSRAATAEELVTVETMSLPFVRRERHALCDTALALGPAEPTLCEGWTVRDLIAHLLVRESPSVGAAGISIPLMSGFTERAMAAAAREPFEAMVRRLRDPGITPYRLPGVERVVNTLEYFVHHEDLRRAQPDWEPRILATGDQEELWRLLKGVAKLRARKVGHGLVIRGHTRVEASSTAGSRHVETTARRGAHPIQLAGPVTELVMVLFGRSHANDVSWDGPPDGLTQLRRAGLGL